MPVIELTTMGRRSGRPVVHHADLALSGGFDDGHRRFVWRRRPPSRVGFNLREHPEVTVSIGGKPAEQMPAETAVHPETRARLWPLITADHRNYAGYERKTNREIPVVLLRPISG